MTVIYESGYTLPGSDDPLTHTRILHANSWVSGGTSNASSTDPDYSADAPLNTLTYEKWKPAPASSAPTWEHDFGSSIETDVCCVAGHNLGSLGVSIRVQSHDGASWSNRTADVGITSDAPIMFIYEPVTAQRWRLNITTMPAKPTIAVVKFGTMWSLPRPTFGGNSPIDWSRQTTIRGNISETGEVLGRSKIRTQLAASYEWKNLDYLWCAAAFPSLLQAIEAEPFFLAWRPAKDGSVGYCTADGTEAPQFQGIRDLMSWKLSVRGLAYD
jgi:hypothetical protein